MNIELFRISSCDLPHHPAYIGKEKNEATHTQAIAAFELLKRIHPHI